MFGTVDIGKGWHSQVCQRAIGGIYTCHKMRHSRLSPQSHTYVWESFHIFIMARQRPFCTLSRFKLLQVDRGSSVPLAKCSFGMIPLSRHSVVDHQGRSTPLPTMWYEHLVLRWLELLLNQEICFWMEACAWQGVGHGVGVSGHLRGGSDLRCWRRFGVCGERLSPTVHTRRVLGRAFKRPVIILHVPFRAISTCPVCLEQPHEEQANAAVEKQRAIVSKSEKRRIDSIVRKAERVIGECQPYIQHV